MSGESIRVDNLIKPTLILEIISHHSKNLFNLLTTKCSTSPLSHEYLSRPPTQECRLSSHHWLLASRTHIIYSLTYSNKATTKNEKSMPENTPTGGPRLPSSGRKVGGRNYSTSYAYRCARNAELRRASVYRVPGLRAREQPVQRILFQKLIQERNAARKKTEEVK